MIKTVAEMSTENSTVETPTQHPTPPLSETQEKGVNNSVSINAVPITAILLAMVASCNSGKISTAYVTFTILRMRSRLKL